MADVTIYTQPGCPFCSRALALLSRKGVPVNEINAPHGTSARDDSIRRSGGRTSVPQIFVGDRHLGGCDDLHALDGRGELDGLLGLSETAG
ncbi:MAG: glutaredoxin 3 [Gluconacetobacter diazotrophicus]|nr:glutaredoxin 3 [Gluconacetobacter diazotrophicus]